MTHTRKLITIGKFEYINAQLNPKIRYAALDDFASELLAMEKVEDSYTFDGFVFPTTLELKVVKGIILMGAYVASFIPSDRMTKLIPDINKFLKCHTVEVE